MDKNDNNADEPATFHYSDGNLAKGHVRTPAWLYGFLGHQISRTKYQRPRTIEEDHIFVFGLIATFANADRRCWPSVAAIIKRGGGNVKRSRVFEVLTDLEEIGAIRRGMSTRWGTTVYELAGDGGPLGGSDVRVGHHPVHRGGHLPVHAGGHPPSTPVDTELDPGDPDPDEPRSTESVIFRSRGCGCLDLDASLRILEWSMRQAFPRISDERLRRTVEWIPDALRFSSHIEDEDEDELPVAVAAVASRLRQRTRRARQGESQPMDGPNFVDGVARQVGLIYEHSGGRWEGAGNVDFVDRTMLARFLDEVANDMNEVADDTNEREEVPF